MGDVDGDDDTLKWIKRSKKKEKELAQKRLKDFEDIEKAAEGEYSERTWVMLKPVSSLTERPSFYRGSRWFEGQPRLG